MAIYQYPSRDPEPTVIYGVVDVADALGVTGERVRQRLREKSLKPDFVSGRQAFWKELPVKRRDGVHA